MSNQIESNITSNDEKEIRFLLGEKERMTTECKYLEAETIKNQIDQYKKKVMNQKIVTLREYQQNEKQELDHQSRAELKALNEYWDERIAGYQCNITQLEEDNKAQREKNIDALINILTTSYKTMKYSKEYLECKTLEINLAKKEKFKEAHYYKLNSERIEKEIAEKYSKDKETYIKNQVELYEIKLDTDFWNLQERCKVNLNLLKIQKEKEVSQLNKKYRNRKNELNDIHMLQNKISQNENHLRAKVTANRISSLMRNTTSKTSKKEIHYPNNNRKSPHKKYSNNHTQHNEKNEPNEVSDCNNDLRNSPLGNDSTNEGKLKKDEYEAQGGIGGSRDNDNENGYSNQIIDFEKMRSDKDH